MEKLLRHIDKLRDKPESHRRRVQVIASASITLLIIILWGVSFAVSSKPQVATDNSVSPLGSIKEDLTATVEQVRDGYVILKGDK